MLDKSIKSQDTDFFMITSNFLKESQIRCLKSLGSY